MVATPSPTLSALPVGGAVVSGGRTGIPLLLLLATALAAASLLLFEPSLLLPTNGTDVVSALPAFVVFFAAGIVLVLVRRGPREVEVKLYALAFVLRALMSVVMAFSFQFDDEFGLHSFAQRGDGSGAGGYTMMLHGLYVVFGANLIVAKALNVALGSLLVVIVGDLLRDRKGKRRAQLLALACPPLVVYGAVNLKETVTALLIVTTVASIVRALRGELTVVRAAYYVGLSGSTLWFLRGLAWAVLVGLAVVGGLAFELVAGRRENDRRRLMTVVPLFLIAAVVAAPVLSRSIVDDYVSQRAGSGQVSTYYVDRTYAAESGVTGYLDPNNPLGGKNLLILWGRGLFVPSPFRAITEPSAARTAEVAGTIGWYVLLILAVGTASWAWRARGTPLIIGSALVLSFATASLSSLGADPARHRIVVIPLLCALASVSPALTRQGRHFAFARYAMPGGVLLYNSLWVIALVRGGVGG